MTTMNSLMQPFFINYQNHILAVSARAIWAAKREHSNLCEASVYLEYRGRRNGEILMIWIWILSRRMINSTRSCSFWLASFFFLSISIDHQFPPASVIKVKRRQVHYDAINYLLRLHFLSISWLPSFHTGRRAAEKKIRHEPTKVFSVLVDCYNFAALDDCNRKFTRH